MSTRTTQAETDTCDDPECDEQYIAPNGIDGHCSQDCADRHRGRNLLRNVREDHRWCWSCWRARKTIEQPTEQYRNRAFDTSGAELTQDADGEVSVERYGQEVTRDAVCGFEHYTRHVTPGPHGLECSCDAISHDIADWDRRDEGAYAWRLMLVVEQMAAEGQNDYGFDVVRFADTLWQTDDLELAVGRALE